MKNRFKNTISYALMIAVLPPLMLCSQRAMADQLQLGMAVLNTHSAIQGKPAETKAYPAIVYQNNGFSFRFDTLAYRLLTSEHQSLSIIAKPRQQTYEPGDSEILDGMEKRDNAFDMGFNLQSDKPWGTLELSVLGDVSSTYNGYEVKASYAYPRIHGRWLLKPEVGVRYLSPQLVDYYYGVKNSEQTVDRPAYRGDAAVNSFIGMSIFYQFNERWATAGGLEYVHLDTTITKSPIVDENHEAMLFVMVTYTY